jgi:hypothetical protein
VYSGLGHFSPSGPRPASLARGGSQTAGGCCKLIGRYSSSAHELRAPVLICSVFGHCCVTGRARRRTTPALRCPARVATRRALPNARRRTARS